MLDVNIAAQYDLNEDFTIKHSEENDKHDALLEELI